MKMLKFVLFLFVTIGFTGCLDIYEKIDVKKNGSGLGKKTCPETQRRQLKLQRRTAQIKTPGLETGGYG